MLNSIDRWREDREAMLAIGFIVVLTIGVTALALTREFLNFGPETDVLGAFVPEAERLLDGRPLLVEYHPPVYTFALAFVKLLTGDWIVAALLISLVSAALTAAAVFGLYRQVDGRVAAWGTLLGLAISVPFVEYSATASTEIFFLALFFGSCFFAFRALRSGDSRLWFVGGMVAGLGMLTRINGVTLAALFLLPAAAPADRRLRGFVAVGAGLLLPLAAWGGLAAAAGMPFLPAGSHANLAATYFSDRVSGDDLALMAERFDSLWAVVAYDPLHMAKVYVRDLYGVAHSLLLAQSPFPYPVNLFVLPGLLLLLVGAKREHVLLLALVILPQLLLVNMKEFLVRYYIFLVPLFGAGLGTIAVFVWRAADRRSARILLGAVGAGVVLLGVMETVRRAHDNLHAADAELGQAVAAAHAAVVPPCGVVARKPHVPFYTGCTDLLFPATETFDDLREWTRARGSGANLYLYYGSAERQYRPQFSILAEPAGAPSWLEPIASGAARGGWVLYRYVELDAPEETEASRAEEEVDQ